MYYPARVRQLVGQLLQSTEHNLQEVNTQKKLIEIINLMDYYRNIYTLLCDQASRQLEQVLFRRENIPVKELLLYGVKKTEKMISKSPDLLTGKAISCNISDERAKINIIGDRELLGFLIENIVEGDWMLRKSVGTYVKNNNQPEFLWKIEKEDTDFITFSFNDYGLHLSDEQLNELFYPDIRRIPYMICRQIVRDHDEYTSRRGGRICAYPLVNGGYSLWVSLSIKNK